LDTPKRTKNLQCDYNIIKIELVRSYK